MLKFSTTITTVHIHFASSPPEIYKMKLKEALFFFFFFLLIDMKHLEEVLQKVKEEDARGKRKLTRRFIIFEGLSFNSGGTKKKTKKKKTF